VTEDISLKQSKETKKTHRTKDNQQKSSINIILSCLTTGCLMKEASITLMPMTSKTSLLNAKYQPVKDNWQLWILMNVGVKVLYGDLLQVTLQIHHYTLHNNTGALSPPIDHI